MQSTHRALLAPPSPIREGIEAQGVVAGKHAVWVTAITSEHGRAIVYGIERSARRLLPARMVVFRGSLTFSDPIIEREGSLWIADSFHDLV